jgi:hypothetical protein
VTGKPPPRDEDGVAPQRQARCQLARGT